MLVEGTLLVYSVPADIAPIETIALGDVSALTRTAAYVEEQVIQLDEEDDGDDESDYTDVTDDSTSNGSGADTSSWRWTSPRVVVDEGGRGVSQGVMPVGVPNARHPHRPTFNDEFCPAPVTQPLHGGKAKHMGPGTMVHHSPWMGGREKKLASVTGVGNNDWSGLMGRSSLNE